MTVLLHSQQYAICSAVLSPAQTLVKKKNSAYNETINVLQCIWSMTCIQNAYQIYQFLRLNVTLQYI
jgi:hypothetical protein